MIRIRSKLTVLAVATCLVFCGGCSSGLSNLPPLESVGVAEVKLAPGDKIMVSVQELETMSGEYIVNETGVISLPFIDQVQAAGRSYVQLQNAVADRLVAADVVKKPNVTVQPLDLRPIYVIGEVRRPGEYAFRQGLTVFAAIAMAGGYSYRAETGKVAVTRTVGDKTTTAVGTEDSVILPGDRIRVYEGWF